MKKTIFYCILTLAVNTVITVAFAQQDAIYSHYGFNTLAVNPAYAGSREALTITALHRSQWVGFEGAPITQSLSMHTPLKNGKIGLGITALHDQWGPVTTNGISVDYSYRIKFTRKKYLSLGLKATGNFIGTDLFQLNAKQQEEIIGMQSTNKFLPNVGAGIYYTAEKWYVGLGVPRFLEQNFGTNTTYSGKQIRHYFFTAGSLFKINKYLQFKPLAMVRFAKNVPFQGDLTGMFVFNKQFEIGGMIRSGDAIGLLMGITLKEKLRIGYSFDWSYGIRTANFSAGSHEVMLRYDFIQKVRRSVISPRYF